MNAYHNPRLAQYRAPLGAVPWGSRLELRVRFDEPASCFLLTHFEGAERVYPMSQDSGQGRVCISMPSCSGLFYYRFVFNDGQSLRYLGPGGLSDELGEAFFVTVHKPYKTPNWAKNAVMYQIFPDRFYRSGQRGGLDRISCHTSKGRRAFAHENWSDQPDYKPRVPEQTYYEPVDFFGGDLQGIREKLPYLADLGVGCIYLNPVFEAHSNHRYNTSDYSRVDPVLGSNGDLVSLFVQAARLGIRVILDGVFSHTGDDSVYFDRYGRYGGGACQSAASPYMDWYSFSKYPTEYSCWWGFDTLPNVNEMTQSYRQFIAQGPHAIIKQYVRMGSAGWRLDVADELPDQFISILRTELKKTNPNALLLGEVWEDAALKESMGGKRRYVFGDELDSVMNYPLYDGITGYLLGNRSAQSLAGTIQSLQANYPKEFYYACMNLLSTHDTPRILSLLGGGPGKNSGASREEQAAFTLCPEQLKTALWRMRQALLLQMTLPGMPSVYYGDEAGLQGLMDPFCRAAYPWGGENTELRDYVKKLIGLRNSHVALRTGHCSAFAAGEAMVVLRFTQNEDAFKKPCPTEVFLTLCCKGGDVALDLAGPFEGVDEAPSLDGRYENVLTGDQFCCKRGVMTVKTGQSGIALLKMLV